jgi:SAM-dependent methyltransferase
MLLEVGAMHDGFSSAQREMPNLYGDLAGWWHLLSDPADYADEAASVHRLLGEFSERPVRTLLELGSGGGNNASHLKARYELTLVDRSAPMLAASRSLNPECEHVEGDMRTLRLGRVYDAVFIHDAIMYMTTEVDLRSAMETAHVHCRPGGVAVLVPDCTRETFRAEARHGGHDGRGAEEGRALRYLEWTHEPDEGGTTYTVDFAYLLRGANGQVRAVYDRHVMGLFRREVWLRLLGEIGFEPHTRGDDYGRELFIGVKG